MKPMPALACALVLLASSPLWAQQHADHQTAPEAPAVHAQIDAMHAMHKKMMAAKDPAERKALMAEHENMMREGMKMMDGMSQEGHGAKGCDMGERERHMAMRMEMMQAMMQMMMDHMAHDPKK
jgi:hypothetical protein